MSLEKQIEQWENGAKGAIIGADAMFSSKQYGLALFCCHLAVEKLLKAKVTGHIKQYPPYTHNLQRLVEIAGIEVSRERLGDLAALTSFNLRGRYGDDHTPQVNREVTQYWIEHTKEIMLWLDRK